MFKDDVGCGFNDSSESEVVDDGLILLAVRGISPALVC